MTKQELDNLIIENINTNDAGLITGLVLQQVLLNMTNFTDEQVTAILAQLHSHSNKQYLDLIQEKDINVLSKLSIVNGNLQIDGNAYSTGELSAYGLGPQGGGSGGTTVTWGATVNNYSLLTVEGEAKNVALSGHKHAWGDLVDLPDTLSGYGIIDAYTKTQVDQLLDGVGTGSVTSVGMTVPTGLTVTGSPITTSGTLALGFQSGYSIPTIDKQNNWDAAYTNTHTHSNKAQIDLITQAHINVLNKLFIDADGNVYTTENFYSTKEVSAYGLGSGGGSGGAGALYELSDTSVASRVSGDILVYNGTHWENRPQSSIIPPLLALGETSATAYRGDRGKVAYDHALTEHQTIINGTGFVKASGKTLSYDNSSYSLSNHNHNGIYEPVLDNPAVSGYLLSSTTAGVRSWVAPYSLPTASASVLGGVKIGTNVSISNGVISVHNPVTIGTNSNGLSLSTQVLSLALATTSANGALSATDKTYIELLKTFFEYDSANNAIKALKSFYSTGEVSAYGLGSGGGGGTGYNRLDAWADYDSTKSGWVLSALLGVNLNTRLSNVESGSATEVTTSGTGNAITSISKSGNVITANKGSKFAELGEDGLILTSQLPSYVDDVLEFATLANFPTTGETGKIYVATNTNLTYRWTGTTYVEISKSLALGETSSTAYRGDHGLIAYNHSQSEHQTIINGTGFVKANGKTLSYDNTTYEPAFTKNTAFNKNFGTTAGTVAQGNDSRIINGQTAFGWGDHSSAGYALNSALTAHTGNSTIHITSTERNNWNDANSKKHTHGNKSVIDALTQGHIDVLSKLSIDANGDLKIDTNAYSTGELSAYGAGAGGGSGSGGALYDLTDVTIPNRTTGDLLVYNGTHWVNQPQSSIIPNLTGYATESWSDNRFALKSHSHTIAQVTGLQSALDGKQATLTPGSNITISGSTISAVDTTYGVATTSANGLMSSADKSKLNGIEAGANNYSLPTASASVLGGIKVGSLLTISSGVLSANVQSDNNFTSAYKTKLDGIEAGANNYVHPSSHPISFITGLQTALDGKEPSFTKNTAFNKNFGTTAGTVAQGNDSRIINGQTAFGWGDHSSAGYALAIRNITAGNGLTGGGNLTANRTLTLGTPSSITATSTNSVTATSHTHKLSMGSDSGLDADLLDGVHKTAFPQYFHYSTTSSGSGWYKIKILSSVSWMAAITVKLYQGYRYDEIVFLGYQYGANYWYSPNAILKTSSGTSITVHFGYDSVSNLWVAVPAGNYTGMDVHVTNGYYQVADWSNNISVTKEATLTGTIQKTQTIYRPLDYNENAVSATKLQTARNINGTSFDGTANITTANWGTARNISIGGTSKSVNGSANVTWATSEIAAQSAIQLATARTIWGQSFNGTGNVSGALSGATTGTFSSTLSANRIVVTSTSNEKHLEFSRSDYNYITSKGHIGFITGGTGTGSANQQVWIHSNGNTKIGAGSSSVPEYTLDVNGTGRFTGNIIASGEVTAYVASDRRLKENITPITSALDYINRLNPVTYNWNAKAKELNSNKPNSLDYGLIAQEVESVLPNIVHGIFDDKYKSIDYIKLIPIMIGAIKELKQEINRLKK